MFDTMKKLGDFPMISTMKKLVMLGLVATVAAGGCATPEDIDRVQPDLIEKSKLQQGEWYLLDTIVQAPYASHAVFPGLQGTLERGVFEVEEDYLYFYRTYEFIEGLESQGIKSDTDTPLLDADGNPITYEKVMPNGEVKTVTRYVFRSSPLAAWTITGHYDVRRQYNPLTGEEGNVIVEDSSEKYWYQRDFMRVDFGKDNTSHNGRFSYWKWYNATIYDGETGPDELKLRIEDDGNYMDFVVRGFMQAPQQYLSGFGYVPTCLFFPWYTGSYYECNEEEVHIRTALMKVDPDNTYKPQSYDDHMLNKFGFYRSARGNWDKQYGITFSDAIRYVRRFRLWEDYVEGADGEMDYANMKPQPVVYYLSEQFPRELLPGAMDLADQWNAIFVEVVETLSGKPYDGRMFVLCENNMQDVADFVAADDNALLAQTDGACKDMDKPKYRGDLRYNLLVSVDEPVQYGLYGYGPMHSDPLTGETIHANAFNYTANMRLGARNAVDMIEYAAGVQTFRDVTQAAHITSSVKAKALRGSSNEPKITSIEAAQSMAATAISPAAQEAITSVGPVETDTDWARAQMSKLSSSGDLDWVWNNHDMAAAVGLPFTQYGVQPDDQHFLRDLVHPASLASEDLLMWQEKQDAHLGEQAICMGTEFDDSFKGLAYEYKSVYDKAMCEGLAGREGLVFDFSVFGEPGASCDADTNSCGDGQVCQYLDQGDVTGYYCVEQCSTGALLQQLREEIRRVNQISEFDYWDPNALYASTKDGRVIASQEAAKEIIAEIREQVFAEVYDRIWSTVAMHEVGHNVGLRHNFASSTDALNYFPEYWNLKGTEAGGQWHPTSLFEAETEAQVRGRIREYQQTSIMEYTGAFNARYQGLGSYDRAAILFGYGGLVEVFDNPPAASKWEPLLEEPDDVDPSNFGLYPRREQPLARAFRKVHHTNLPEMFGGVDNIYARSVVKYDELFDFSKPCSSLDDPYDSGVCGQAGSFCRPSWSGHYCTKPDMVEVPFRFCSDEYNWTTPDCQTHDEGTDMFQMVRNAIDDRENYWPFRAYKRDNDLFSPSRGYFARVLYDMGFFRKHFEHWAYNYARYNKNDWWENHYGKPWHMDINGGLNQTLAAMNIFDHMANVFGRPSDGYYGWNEVKGRYEPYVDNGKNQYTNLFQVREDTGARPMYPGYDFSGYLYTPARAGTFYDRLAALIYMNYPQMIYVGGIDRTIDTRRFRFSMATVWPQRIQNLLSGLITGDAATVGWCIEHDGVPPTQGGTGDPVRVKPRRWFGTEAELDAHYANCTPLTPEPEYTFPTTQYRVPALAMLYGIAWTSGTYDRTMADRVRIWLDGEGNDVTVPENFEVITYTDPFSGKTYKAPYDPAEFDPNAPISPRDAVPGSNIEQHDHTVWPSAQMLALANKYLDSFNNQQQLSQDYAYSDLQQMVGRLEIVRGLFQWYEYGY